MEKKKEEKKEEKNLKECAFNIWLIRSRNLSTDERTGLAEIIGIYKYMCDNKLDYGKVEELPFMGYLEKILEELVVMDTSFPLFEETAVGSDGNRFLVAHAVNSLRSEKDGGKLPEKFKDAAKKYTELWKAVNGGRKKRRKKRRKTRSKKRRKTRSKKRRKTHRKKRRK